MEPALYSLLTKALKDRTNYKESELIDQIEQNLSKDELCLTVKNYKVDGVSQAIHEKDQAQFRVSGPMGKGLSIDLSGLNIAFAAGTGILPFMDLVGFIARQTLNLQKFDKTSLQSGFLFWLNVRLNSQEKIGDELLTALSETNPDQFRYD